MSGRKESYYFFLMASLLGGIIIGALIAEPALISSFNVQPPQASGQVIREFNLNVTQVEWEYYEGNVKTAWAFNGTVPGPTIRVNEGDLVRITLDNTHSLPHTIHLHGIHPFEMDGNGQEFMGDFMVTQGGDSYTYEFIAKPAGTFIYHCHFNTPTHMAQGMYGAFVVESLTEKPVDKEFVLVLADHQEAFTINGKSFPLTEPLEVQLGDSVRIRIVNAGFEFHAMHLHGYFPDITFPGSQAGSVDVMTNQPGGSQTIEFIADNPGIWLFHCHRVNHVTNDGVIYPGGMLTVLIVEG